MVARKTPELVQIARRIESCASGTTVPSFEPNMIFDALPTEMMNTYRAIQMYKCAILASLVGLFAAAHIAYPAETADTLVDAPKPKIDWTERINKTTVLEGEPILLVMHSARDCIYCSRWKGFLGGEGEFNRWAKTHPGARLFIVERGAIASDETPEDYADEIRWLAKRNETNQNLRPGTPSFEIFVARKIVYRSYGYAAWSNKVFPAIKTLDSRRAPSTTTTE
jgi:hypothetical protein